MTQQQAHTNEATNSDYANAAAQGKAVLDMLNKNNSWTERTKSAALTGAFGAAFTLAGLGIYSYFTKPAASTM